MYKAVIFDFDDTLVVTTEVFNVVRMQFCHMMEQLEVGVPSLVQLVDDLDVKNLKKAGYFAAHCFPSALIEAYEHCCQVNSRPVSDHVRQEVERMGWGVFYQKPSTLDYAHQTLEQLQQHYPLILLTKGEKELQKRRIDESGIKGYFSDTYIVGDKNPELFQHLVRSLNLKPSESWSVGNSIKSDINPALTVGMQAIHFAGTTWHVEEAEPVGSHHKASSLIEVKKIILGSDSKLPAAGEIFKGA